MDDYGRKLLEQGAREEREAIASLLQGWLEDQHDKRSVAEMVEAISARGDKKPAKIEKFSNDGPCGSISETHAKINQLIDAVNALTVKQA